MARRRAARSEAGMVLPTRVMVFSISAVALAGLVFVATQGGDAEDGARPAASAGATADPSAEASQTTASPAPSQPPETAAPEESEPPAPKPPIKRGRYNVVVFNNSNIQGMAGRAATQAQTAGWTVIGSDNWYGTVDTSTVYYPPGDQRAARLLAKDLDILRTKPAIDPMRSDRLTVILTADYPQTQQQAQAG